MLNDIYFDDSILNNLDNIFRSNSSYLEEPKEFNINGIYDDDLKNENESIYFSREQNENEIEENIKNYPKTFNTDEIMNIKENEH